MFKVSYFGLNTYEEKWRNMFPYLQRSKVIEDDGID